MRFVPAIALTACFVMAVPANAKKQPEMSSIELQQMQSRDYEVSKNISFPAVMTVLQDSGYRIQAADKDTGLISGTASTKSHMTWLPFVGFGRSKKTPVISAYVEDRGSGSRIRLNFVLAKTKNQGYGMSWSDEEPINDPAVYRDAFEKIDKEIFVRQAMAAPAAKPASATDIAPSGQSPAEPQPSATATPASAAQPASNEAPAADETPRVISVSEPH